MDMQASGRSARPLELFLQVIRQAESFDQTQLGLQPVRVILFGVLQELEQHPPRLVVARGFAGGDHNAQMTDHTVFDCQVIAKHVRNRLPDVQRIAPAEVGCTFEKQYPPNERIGVSLLFRHFMVNAFKQMLEAPVLKHPGMDEILINRRQFASEKVVEVIDDVWITLHFL